MKKIYKGKFVFSYPRRNSRHAAHWGFHFLPMLALCRDDLFSYEEYHYIVAAWLGWQWLIIGWRTPKEGGNE